MTSVGGGPKQPPGLMLLKYCKNFIGAQNMPIHLINYMFKRGVDASKTNLLKKAHVVTSCLLLMYSGEDVVCGATLSPHLNLEG